MSGGPGVDDLSVELVASGRTWEHDVTAVSGVPGGWALFVWLLPQSGLIERPSLTRLSSHIKSSVRTDFKVNKKIDFRPELDPLVCYGWKA